MRYVLSLYSKRSHINQVNISFLLDVSHLYRLVIANNNFRDPTVPQGIQEENGIEFEYKVYEKR